MFFPSIRVVVDFNCWKRFYLVRFKYTSISSFNVHPIYSITCQHTTQLSLSLFYFHFIGFEHFCYNYIATIASPKTFCRDLSLCCMFENKFCPISVIIVGGIRFLQFSWIFNLSMYFEMSGFVCIQFNEFR